MSMHKIPLTQSEEDGLRSHGLDINTPSQLSDVFRLGIIWGAQTKREAYAAAGFGCLNTDGHIEYTAPYESMCHEHINDGINNFGLDDMAKLKVVPIFYKLEA